MKWLDRLERRFGRFAIPNLTMYIIAAYVTGYLLEAIQSRSGVNILGWLSLNPYAIAHGQVWRLVSWLVTPPSSFDIWTVIMLIFYYQLGTMLERAWGRFRYNFYIFFGLLMTVVGAVLFTVFGGARILMLADASGTPIFTTYYVSISIFLGFAMTFPEEQILLMFIIPIKIKYMALVEIAFLIYDIIQSHFNPIVIIMIVCSLANVILFFFLSRKAGRPTRKDRQRKKRFDQAFYGNGRKSAGPKIRGYGQSGASRQNSGGAGNGQVARHRCAVCGRTELDDPGLEFRFCTKCNGNYEYCQDHLFNHEHVK